MSSYRPNSLASWERGPSASVGERELIRIMAAVAWRARKRCFEVLQQRSLRLIQTNASLKCSGDLKCSHLRKRGLLKVRGRDSVKFLQGLITNNVESFHKNVERKAMYGVFLNANGRTLYDTVLYKHDRSGDVPAFFLECDVSVIPTLTKHLKMFKLRSKVDIIHAEDYAPWVIFSMSGTIDLKDVSSNSDIKVLVKDPRVEQLGFRAVLPKGLSPCVCLEDVYETGDSFEYDVLRAKLGICEGVDEIPPGNAMPLEYNIAYLNGGITFNLGTGHHSLSWQVEDHMVFLGDQKGGGKDQSLPKEFRGEGDFKKINCQKGGGKGS